jgi:glycosyltransferase involved in cell wall biosynthesis
MSPDVIVTAFACHPAMSSEAGIGWVFTRRIAEIAQERGLTVLAVMNGRSAAATEAEVLRLGLSSHVEVRGIDVPGWLGFLKRPQLTRVEYIVWYMRTRALLRKLVREVPAASGTALHVTFASEILPAPIDILPSRYKKVWGPVGSSGDWRAFTLAPREPHWFLDACLQLLRDCASSALAKANARRMDLVLAQSPKLIEQLSRSSTKVEVFPNVVVPDAVMHSLGQLPSPVTEGQEAGPHLIAAGHLISRKRFSLAIAALTHPSLRGAVLDIAGAPWPGRPNYLPALAARLGVSDRVRFLGKLPRTELLSRMAKADVFIHLSAREGASGIVGEATAVGLPVVCFAGTGASAVVGAAQAPAVVLDAGKATVATIASAIRSAAVLPHRKFAGWTEARIIRKLESLLPGSVTEA